MKKAEDHRHLIAALSGIVGRRHVLTQAGATRFYRLGFRSGAGDALAVVRPASLVHLWQVLQACAGADVAVIMQAANTGLTGGSTPAEGGYDRPVVIVSVRRIKGIVTLDDARQVLCLPGSTLHELERTLRPLGREPHSVIGSSCFGASVIGGVCNNSGGSLVRRGTAYTQYALFVRSTPDGGLELVNHLGIDLGDDPIEMLRRIDDGHFTHPTADGSLSASDTGYARQIRDIDAASPARHNADPRCLYEASGSAGKVAVLAVRLDTFPLEAETRTFYIGCNDPARLAELRRRILGDCDTLPIAAEYLHAEAFDLADRYGKDQFLLIDWLGTDRLPRFFALKSRLDGMFFRFRWLPANLVDRALHIAGRFWPDHLPHRMRAWRQRFEHHLLLKTSAGAAASEMRELLHDWQSQDCDVFECSAAEAQKAFLHRFVIAGAAIRCQAVNPRRTGGVLALDIALRRNDRDWFETLPEPISAQLLHRLYYGHFLCHVLHQDYITAPGTDCEALKAQMLAQLDARGARYPAEHNVGHSYRAPPALADFYRDLDPANRFNPGIGFTSRLRNHAPDR
ncbi:D-lactate dehydrogenase [Sphingomonas colocasiae]|uniref:Quinone-dependent D-lactate dehydrogenase n=1 Tax=Sphingomonas colocasiae TaxID=1848973 RepID=A0ABS7PXL6_9SPHN|nr:D-lactate dehydrogenase [Sphingomonas colocasiae]MBY8825390.1 D-lactate dehydrogenase [Sphingomonas colocasiae]